MTAPHLPTPAWREDEASQIPALQLLVNLGWSYLPPDEALSARGGRTNRVLLTAILARQLAALNTIRFKGEEYAFSEANIQDAIQTLENREPDNPVGVNEGVYDLLTRGASLTPRGPARARGPVRRCRSPSRRPARSPRGAHRPRNPRG